MVAAGGALVEELRLISPRGVITCGFHIEYSCTPFAILQIFAIETFGRILGVVEMIAAARLILFRLYRFVRLSAEELVSLPSEGFDT